jgi:hypothetical protein
MTKCIGLANYIRTGSAADPVKAPDTDAMEAR